MNHIAASVLLAVAVAMTLPHNALAQDSQRDSASVSSPAVAATDSSYHPEELRSFVLGMVGPRPALRVLALSGFDQWRKRPTAFPPNGRGFADRLGSRYGQLAISHTLRFSFARAFDQRVVRYQLCVCGDSISRFRYALLAPLRVDTPHGRRLSMLYPVTELASGILVTAARSDGLHVRDGIRNALTGIAAESGTALVREFWPWHWRPPFL